MELTNLDTRKKAHEGIDVPLIIKNETKMGDDGKPVTFRLKGIHDPELSKALRQRTLASNSDEDVSFDEGVLRLAVIGWSGNWTLEGKKPKFSPEVRDEIVAIPLVREALVGKVMAHEAFMNGPSGGPSSTSDNKPG